MQKQRNQKILENLEERLNCFYELSDAEKQTTLQAVRELINSAPEAFTQAILKEEVNYLNILLIIYEALSADLNNWSNFFLAELKRLFATAKEVKSPKSVMTHLNELSFINADNFKYRDEFISKLIRELDNPNDAFRYYAISLLPDFIRENDILTINKMKQHLSDPNWRVRYSTFMN